MKRKLIVALIIISILLLSGCVSETNVESKEIKSGQLIDVRYNRGWWDFPNSVELFFFDTTKIKIDDEWFWDKPGDNNRVAIYGVKLDNLYSFCKYHIGRNVTIIYDTEEGICYSIDLQEAKQ